MLKLPMTHLTVESFDQVRDELQRLIVKDDRKTVLLDCANIQNATPDGLAALYELQIELEKVKQLTLCNVTPEFQEVLRFHHKKYPLKHFSVTKAKPAKPAKPAKQSRSPKKQPAASKDKPKGFSYLRVGLLSLAGFTAIGLVAYFFVSAPEGQLIVTKSFEQSDANTLRLRGQVQLARLAQTEPIAGALVTVYHQPPPTKRVAELATVLLTNEGGEYSLAIESDLVSNQPAEWVVVATAEGPKGGLWMSQRKTLTLRAGEERVVDFTFEPSETDSDDPNSPPEDGVSPRRDPSELIRTPDQASP